MMAQSYYSNSPSPLKLTESNKKSAKTLAPLKGKGTPSTEEKSQTGNSQMSGGSGTDHISLATYVCDLSNVVVGSTKKKSFRLTNVGKLPVAFNFDKKLLTQAGLAIEPDKVQKLPANCSQLFNVVYTTRQNAKFGKQKFVVPIDVKGGPSYQLEFHANLTIPELSMSSDSLDFGKVCV